MHSNQQRLDSPITTEENDKKFIPLGKETKRICVGDGRKGKSFSKLINSAVVRLGSQVEGGKLQGAR